MRNVLAVLKPFISNEKGTSIVMIAVTMTVLLGITAFTVDAGNLYFIRRNHQNVADAAALAAVRLLPDTVASEQEAIEYVTNHNALTDADVVVTFEGNPGPSDEVEVAIQTEEKTFFARILNHDSADVGASATAKKDVTIRSFSELFADGDLLLWSETDIDISGSVLELSGKSHSNENTNYAGANHSGGPVYASGEANVGNFTGDVVEGAPKRWPTLDLDMDEATENPYTNNEGPGAEIIITEEAIYSFDGDVEWKGMGAAVPAKIKFEEPGVIYIENGDLKITGGLEISGVGYIVVTDGDIKFPVSASTTNPGDYIVFYAPNGDVSLPSALCEIHGSVLANSIGGEGAGGAVKRFHGGSDAGEIIEEILPDWEEEVFLLIR